MSGGAAVRLISRLSGFVKSAFIRISELACDHLVGSQCTALCVSRGRACCLVLDNTPLRSLVPMIGAHAVDTRTEPVSDGDPGWTPLIDVRSIPLSKLVATRDSTLNRSMRRLVESLDDPNGVLSAFSSFVDS